MKDLLKIIKEEFGDEILDVDELDDEIKVWFEECEIKINDDRKVDIYRRYIYDDNDDEDTMSEQEKYCDTFKTLLLNEFKETPQVYDDSCIGCPAVDEIVGL